MSAVTDHCPRLAAWGDPRTDADAFFALIEQLRGEIDEYTDDE